MTAAAPHRPGARHIELHLQVLPGNKLRVSTPQARGHAQVARGPFQLWNAVMGAFREATIQGYALWQGVTPDLDALTEPDDPTEPPRRTSGACQSERLPVSYSKRSIVRPDIANPGAWSPEPDGRWRSPNGRRWRSDSPAVRTLIPRRALMGLSTSWDEEQGRTA